MRIKFILSLFFLFLFSIKAQAVCPYDINCLNNPYGAGSPYKPDGLMNPYSKYGSPYSNQSWTNPYATNPPKIYDKFGLYKTDYLIAADFDFFLRIFLIHKVKFIPLNLLITRMKTGGISGKNLYAYLISTFEIIKSFING